MLVCRATPLKATTEPVNIDMDLEEALKLLLRSNPATDGVETDKD